MSRSRKGNKGCGYEYDSRRHPNGWKIGIGDKAKRMTNRAERRTSSLPSDEGEELFICSRCGDATNESDRSPGTTECIYC